jgi:hypothetical protein
MAMYKRFEDLPVWRESIRIASDCEDFICAAKNDTTWSKRDQIDRALLSRVTTILQRALSEGTQKNSLPFCKSHGAPRGSASHALF